MFNKSFFSSAEKFRVKTGRTMVGLCGCKGISEFCRGGNGKARQNSAAVVLPVFPGKGMARAWWQIAGKETSLLT